MMFLTLIPIWMIWLFRLFDLIVIMSSLYVAWELYLLRITLPPEYHLVPSTLFYLKIFILLLIGRFIAIELMIAADPHTLWTEYLALATTLGCSIAAITAAYRIRQMARSFS